MFGHLSDIIRSRSDDKMDESVAVHMYFDTHFIMLVENMAFMPSGSGNRGPNCHTGIQGRILGPRLIDTLIGQQRPIDTCGDMYPTDGLLLLKLLTKLMLVRIEGYQSTQ